MIAALALTALLAVAPSSTAADLGPAFAGTIVSTYPDGRIGKLWLERDGTYRGQGRRGDGSSGAWSLRDGRICLKQRRPFWVPFTYCTAVPNAQTWSAKAPTGEPIRVRLEAGR